MNVLSDVAGGPTDAPTSAELSDAAEIFGLLADPGRLTLLVTLRTGPAIDVGMQGNGCEFTKAQGLLAPKHPLRMSSVLLKESDDAQTYGPIYELSHALKWRTSVYSAAFEQTRAILCDLSSRGVDHVKSGVDARGGECKAEVRRSADAAVQKLAG